MCILLISIHRPYHTIRPPTSITVDTALQHFFSFSVTPSTPSPTHANTSVEPMYPGIEHQRREGELADPFASAGHRAYGRQPMPCSICTAPCTAYVRQFIYI
jgi:hypothetical protein